MIFGTVKEGIDAILDDCLGTFCSKMVVLVGAHSLTFLEFWTCGALEFFERKDLIMNRLWLEEVRNAFQSIHFPMEAKFILTSCLLKDSA